MLKHAQAKDEAPKSAIYWTISPTGPVVETACVFKDTALTAVSFDGSTEVLAAGSCKIIFNFFTQDDGQYWVKKNAGTEKVQCFEGNEIQVGFIAPCRQ